MNITSIIIALLVSWSSAMASSKVIDISAHRGDSGRFAGNGREAFQSALYGLGSSIEFDIHLTKQSEDGSDDFIVFHDYSMVPSEFKKLKKRMLIYNETFEAVRGYEYIPTGANLPSLDEFFHLHREALARGVKKLLHIEIKLKSKTSASTTKRVAERLVEAIQSWDVSNYVLVRSFNWEVLKVVKLLAPEIPIVLLIESGDFSRINIEKVISEYDPCRVSPKYTDVNSDLVQKWVSKGVRVSVYTVNNTKHIQGLIEMGVSEITTNFPDKFSAFISQNQLGQVGPGEELCAP